MLSKQDFDLWANGYDKTVQVSEESGVYPFAGYRAILNTIFNEVMVQENASWNFRRCTTVAVSL